MSRDPVGRGVLDCNRGTDSKHQAVSQEDVTRSIAQVCANKALMSVKKMRAGNRVAFDEEGTYIEDKVTG